MRVLQAEAPDHRRFRVPAPLFPEGQEIRAVARWFVKQGHSSFGTYVPKALYLQGQALLGLGQEEVARGRLREARTEAEANGSRWMLWQILASLVKIETDPSEAEPLCQEAQEVVEYIVDHISVPDLQTSFLDLRHLEILR